jgi:hypothetical protein
MASLVEGSGSLSEEDEELEFADEWPDALDEYSESEPFSLS